jgi:DNA primase
MEMKPMETNSYIMSRDRMRSVWQHANWQKVIEVFGLKTDQKRCGKPDEIWIRSPFTHEDNASLHLNLTKNIFKDFSGGKGAQKGILNFCQELLSQQGLKLNCYEVAQWMVDHGISSVPAQNPNKNFTHNKLRDEKEKRVPGNKPVNVDLRPWLQSHHPKLKRRGISAATCRYLGCGYLPPLGSGEKKSPLNGRIVFQVRGISDRKHEFKPTILTHVGRAITQKQEKLDGKYWSYPFRKGLEIYNQDNLLFDCQARRQIEQYGIIIVEGFFDVASLVESGCLNVGALMGVELTQMQIARLKFICSYVGVEKIKLFLDRDGAGSAGSLRAVSLLKRNGVEIDVFNWNQRFCLSNGSRVGIPEKIKDAGDMSAKQLHWLRKQGKI